MLAKVQTRAKNKPCSPARDAERWAAVQARDRASDGSFYYAVETTGIYCRPSCPSKRPSQANVAFFDTPAEAERAGNRACKRCRPDELSPDQCNAARITRTCRMIEEAEAAPSLVLLARAAGLSPSHFHRLFKLITGVTPKAYAEARRRNSVRERLTKAATVTEAVHDAGYNSASRFYANSDEVLGMKVAAYREGGTGARLRTAIGECELGTVLIAATGKGVAAILLGDNPETLLRDLQTRFPKAEFFSGDKQFENLAAKVIAYIENPSRRFELPLDVRGTAFQHRVWQALRDIPFGQTASYTDIAQKIGKPDAVRAVALACGANPAAVAIPCHRVVRNDGGLSGYRWGIDRKRTLLAREAGPAKAKKRQPAAARRTTVDKA